MKRRVALATLIVVILVTVYLAGAQAIYASHEAAATAAVAEVLEGLDGQLPRDDVELTMLDQDGTVVGLYDVADWQVEAVTLRNTRPTWQMVVDDDPTYRLQADLRVRYEDGREAKLAWESWRYGLVVGPLVISRGDGPPGWIAVASASEDVD
jgi:hypothetical protein